ncbi:uncharacterized protein [Dermacentor albipictus]|uniref:uncharacterized protein isoform X2 n=1 Tax=Dermacentor albipictus TaxID=60249 RepID=UPI0031FCB4AB
MAVEEMPTAWSSTATEESYVIEEPGFDQNVPVQFSENRTEEWNGSNYRQWNVLTWICVDGVIASTENLDSENAENALVPPEAPVQITFPPVVATKQHPTTPLVPTEGPPTTPLVPTEGPPTTPVVTTKEPVTTPVIVAKRTLPTVETTPAVAVVAPSSASKSTDCGTTDCHFVAQWLRTKLDFNEDPCKDFSRFVCGTYKGPGSNPFNQVKMTMKNMTISAAYATKVPAKNQSSWQKAAGMFQACLSLGQSNRSETQDLVAWMGSLNLDLNDLARLGTVDPTDMIVRCALDFGVQVVFSIEIHSSIFPNAKRLLQLDYSREEAQWQQSRRRIPAKDNLADHAYLLGFYGIEISRALSLASEIIKYEKQLVDIVFKTMTLAVSSPVVLISDMGKKTTPYVTGENGLPSFPNTQDHL